MTELKKASRWKEYGKEHKLFFDVLIIKQKIKPDKLSKYIDNNRRLVLVITKKFIQDENAIKALQVIHDTCKGNIKESVLTVLIDALEWREIPDILKNLLCDKNYIQYPLEGKTRQLMYFWEAVRYELLRVGMHKTSEIGCDNKVLEEDKKDNLRVFVKLEDFFRKGENFNKNFIFMTISSRHHHKLLKLQLFQRIKS